MNEDYAVPPKFTAVAPVKLVPVMVTAVPPAGGRHWAILETMVEPRVAELIGRAGDAGAARRRHRSRQPHGAGRKAMSRRSRLHRSPRTTPPPRRRTHRARGGEVGAGNGHDDDVRHTPRSLARDRGDGRRGVIGELIRSAGRAGARPVSSRSRPPCRCRPAMPRGQIEVAPFTVNAAAAAPPVHHCAAAVKLVPVMVTLGTLPPTTAAGAIAVTVGAPGK